MKDKFGPRSRRCIFLGYHVGKKGWKVMDLETKALFVSRDVRFMEDCFPFAEPTVVPQVELASLPFVDLVVPPFSDRGSASAAPTASPSTVPRSAAQPAVVVREVPATQLASHETHHTDTSRTSLGREPDSIDASSTPRAPHSRRALIYQITFVTRLKLPTPFLLRPLLRHPQVRGFLLHIISLTIIFPMAIGNFLHLLLLMWNLGHIKKLLFRHVGAKPCSRKLRLWNVIILGISSTYLLERSLLDVSGYIKQNTIQMALLNEIKLVWLFSATIRQKEWILQTLLLLLLKW